MLSGKTKKRFDEIKRRAEQRRNELSHVKSERDVAIENQNAVELTPYVYKIIKEADN